MVFRLLILLIAFCHSLSQTDRVFAGVAEDLEKERQDHAARIAGIRLQIRETEQASIARLETLAARAKQAGESAIATRVWREVLTLNREHKKARKHFEAIEQLEETLSGLPKPGDGKTMPIAMDRLRQRLLGTTWTWKEYRFLLRADGRVTWPVGKRPGTGQWSVFDETSIVVKHDDGFYDRIVFGKDVKTFQASSLGRAKKIPGWNGQGRRIK